MKEEYCNKVEYWDLSSEEYENNEFYEKIVEYFGEGYTIEDLYNDADIDIEPMENGDYTYLTDNNERRYVRIANKEEYDLFLKEWK